jgi:4-amino-4-deoxy-L-arabinose transferase-like glycosyltransferase
MRGSPGLTRSIALILAVWALTTLAGLGSTSLSEPDEPRFAEATRQMFLRHDFLTPYFNGVPRFEKPILFYWMQAAAFAVLGPTETAARLPAALSGLGVLLLTFLIGDRLATRRAALTGTLVLATTFRFAVWSRQGLTDMPVLFWTMAALYGFLRALEPDGTRRHAFGAWAAIGLGALTKGPAAILAPMVLTLYVLASGQWREARRLHITSGLLLAAAIALPWYCWMAWLHGRSFGDFAILHEVVARYGYSDTAFPTTPRGYFWYLQVYPGDAAPWTLFVVAAIGWAFWQFRTFTDETRRAVLFLLIWFFAIIVIFSTSRFKVTHYILPAYPAAALLAGLVLDRLFSRASDVPAWLWRVPFVFTTVVMAALCGLLAAFLHRVFGTPWIDVGMLLPVAFGGTALAMMVYGLAGRREEAVSSLVAGLAAGTAFLAVHTAPQELQPYQPIRALGERVALLASPGSKVGLSGRLGGPGLIFYSRHDITWLDNGEQISAFLHGDGERFCVISQADFDAIPEPQAMGLEIVERGSFFNVRLKTLFESRPNVTGRSMLLVTNRRRIAGEAAQRRG